MLPGCYEESSAKASRTTLLFAIEDRPGALDACLQVFKDAGLNLKHIESRPSKTFAWDYEFTIELETSNAISTGELAGRLGKAGAKNVQVVGRIRGDAAVHEAAIPWFPRRMADLDSFASKTLEYGAELSADHPGFTDESYRRRRAEITAIAKAYRTGMEIPRIQYTKEEIETWRAVYTELKQLYPSHACKEHQYVFPLLEQNCGYGPDGIPQLEDVSRFLRGIAFISHIAECTGFTLRPVMGLLSSRDFLNGLAFRVFHSTQYVRHHSRPHYTPEPDVCHELLGHVPLFANAAFAAFSQEIGLSSLGASDEDIQRLATIYWFTVEFGLCRDGDQLKAYGAGLLSSFGELEYCLSGKPQLDDFNPDVTGVTAYPITCYQPKYFVARSFPDAQAQVRLFASTKMHRPFSLKYDPYTGTVIVLDSTEKIVRHVGELRGQIDCLVDALQKMH